jgi:hypothetical protein
MINGITTLRINNNPSYEVHDSNWDLPFLRRLTYSDKNPNPITSQSVSSITIIVGVFMLSIFLIFEIFEKCSRQN